MIIWAMIRRSDPEPLEISAGLMALAWGLNLALFGSWSSGTTDGEPNVMHILSAVIWGQEWRQGIAFAVVGAAQLFTVETQAPPHVRAVIAFAAFILWGMVAASFILGAVSAGTPGTGATVYSLFVIFVGWIVYRQHKETRIQRRISEPCPAK